MRKYNTVKSFELFQELKEYLLDGVSSSFHKSADEEYPISFSYGKGSKLYDVDGNEYIDYVNGLGPMILGYSPAALNAAAIEQIKLGTHFAAPNLNLLKLSKKITDIIPCAEMVSFQNTGTEINLFAFRIARAYTHKNKIIKFEGQYHGWADEEKISIDASSVADLGERNCPNKIIHNPGQPTSSTENIIILPWNDYNLLEEYLSKDNDIAAVIMEPFMCDSGPILPFKDYLQQVREITSRHNVVLIFDEVITGFHMALGGAQEYYHVTPDLAVFAKAVSGGYPLAFCAGKKEIMSCGVHASGTFNGNALSVAAALATIDELEKPGTYEFFNRLGNTFCNGLTTICKKYNIPVFTDHLGAICVMQFGVTQSTLDFRDFLQKADTDFYNKVVLLSRSYGVRFTPKRGRLYLSKAHTFADIEKTLQVLDVVFNEILKGGIYEKRI